MIAAVGLFAPVRVIAQHVSTTGYQVDIFTSDEGLPGHTIHDIEQTEDGYLWVTTNTEMARFDGYEFETFPDVVALQPDGHQFADLYVLPGDTLLISTTLGYVAHYADGSFAPYALESEPGIGELLRDSSGRWWGVRNLQLLREAGGHLTIFRENAGGSSKQRMFVESDGDSWVIIRESVLSPQETTQISTGSDSGRFVVARLDDGQIASVGSTLFEHMVTLPSRGEVLFSRRQGNVVEFHNETGVIRGSYVLAASSKPLLIDHQGHLWVDDGGLLRNYAPGASSPEFEVEVPQGGVSSWLEDREGNLWVGTKLDGLMRIRRNLFDVFMPPGETEALSITQGRNESVLAVFAFDFRAYRIRNRQVSHFLSGVQGLYEDPTGHIIYQGVSPEPYTAIRVRTTDGRDTVLTQTRGALLYSNVYPDPKDEGVFWTHDAKTVYRIDDPFSGSPGLTTILDSLTEARHLLRDRSGDFWVASRGGLLRMDETGVSHFTVEDGLPDNYLRTVLEDAQGTLWIGTRRNGLVRFRNGQFETVTSADGLSEDVVSSILEDDDGFLWMSGDRGVQRAHRDSLNAFLDGDSDGISSVLYGRESGMLNPEASGFAALRALDGRMWFPTFAGAVVVNPSTALELERHPPLMHVTGVRAGDELMPARKTVRLEADQRRLEVTYVGLSLRHPERTTYRYRLSGFDDDWVDAGVSRSAVYTNLSAGTHTFEVQARSFGGIWSEIDDTLTLHVDSFFYETWWFAVLVGLGMLSVATIIYWRRIQALEQRQTELHALVDERTKELVREKEVVAAQAEKLRSLDKAKSRLFANVSHEFRTPLTLILGPLEDLQEDREGPLPDRVRRHIVTATENGRRLLRLVNQLLDISRLESGRVELKARKVDLGTYVERIVQAFAPLGERRHVDLQFDPPGASSTVYIDPEQFEKVLANLLGNALKFTPEEGSVRVDISDNENQVIVRVRDNGPGIAPEHLPHLFDRFYQADASSTRRVAGTGIGLALVKSLVELHRGTVEVESSVGFGTTFTIRLQKGTSHLRPDEIVEQETVDFSPPILSAEVWAEPIRRPSGDIGMDEREEGDHSTTVLVVDDNADVRAYVRRLLGVRFRVLEAADGREALEKTRESMPDIIVSDIMMPEMNGYELCRALRNDPNLAFIPVVLLTARASTDSRLVGLEEGADDYLTKPFNVRELEIRIENLLASRQRLKAAFSGTEAGKIGGNGVVDGAIPEDGSFVSRVREIIAARLSDDEFGVDALASTLGMGRTTLYSRLSDEHGTSPMEMIWRMRLEQAAWMLRERKGNVSEVAYGVGFKSVGHFCRRFRSEYGCSPTEYIERMES